MPNVVAGCARSEEDVREAFEIGLKVFGGTISWESYIAMWEKNPSTVHVVRSGGRIVGYLDLFPLQPAFRDGLLSGRFTEVDLRPGWICSRGEALEMSSLSFYLGGVAVSSYSSLAVGSRLQALMTSFRREGEHYRRTGIEILACATSTQGEALLWATGFCLAVPGMNLYRWHSDWV
jgi:hypothetical protein